jgi:hypothetical protein
MIHPVESHSEVGIFTIDQLSILNFVDNQIVEL